jgi:ABC-type Fe3+/spermidine/putrescine transport system ATPase subunit
MTRVRLVGLARAFGSIWAVRDLSLDIAEGEFFSLLGPSGCGKTTTLRLVAGLETPTAGEVWFGHEEVTAMPPQHRNVGLVFQNYAVFPTMTVYENVAYGLRVRRVGRAELHRRVCQMLEIVGLAHLSERTPGQLSGGELQRVALARALAIRPRVLLLDEPLSNLDVKLRVEVRAEIKRLQRESGITTIYVTHDQEEALAISDRLGVMRAGQLEQVGRPQEVYRRPATRFVAGFVGDGAMFDGVVRREDSTVRLIVGDDVVLPLPAETDVVSGPVWVCVRPEAVRPLHASTDSHGLVGVVDHVEFLGHAVRASLRVPGLPGMLRLAASPTDLEDTLVPGGRVRLAINPAGVSLGVRR